MDPHRYRQVTETTDGPSKSLADAPETRTWWNLEYWRSCAICRPVEPRDAPGRIAQDLRSLADEFRDLLGSGCADRVVLDLTMLFPMQTSNIRVIFHLVRLARDHGSLIALVAGDDPTLGTLRLLRFDQMAPILPSVAEATTLLRTTPVPDRGPPSLG